MAERSNVLIAIMNDPRDLTIAQNEHWYRIPVTSAHRFLKDRWPPEWLAFYQTQIFGDEAYSVNYCARVLDVHQVVRRDLFPDQTQDKKADNQYYKLVLSDLERLPRPIPNHRWRRIVFIPTTRFKLAHATEINDLYDASPLEEQMWTELKLRGILAERQEYLQINQTLYELDFSVYCVDGKLNIETDGDHWHSDPKRIPKDNLRDNDLETAGWSLLRFNSRQIREEMQAYCLPTIAQNIQRLGGIGKPANEPVSTNVTIPADWQQLSLAGLNADPISPRRRKKKTRRTLG